MKSNADKQIIDQILSLFDQLSNEGRQLLLERLNDIDEFRREIKKGIDSADRGELRPVDEILNKLRKRAERRLNSK